MLSDISQWGVCAARGRPRADSRHPGGITAPTSPCRTSGFSQRSRKLLPCEEKLNRPKKIKEPFLLCVLLLFSECLCVTCDLSVIGRDLSLEYDSNHDLSLTCCML